ncbi:MAG: TIGR02099 family protein, partial [Gammaproteobacteria bacterium]
PQMIFHCRKFIFEGKLLGEVDFKSYPDDRGLYLDSLTIHSPDFTVSAEGNWTTDDKGQHSDFSIVAQAPALGRLLKRFDYNVAGLEGGEARLEIDARWEGAPADFDLERLNGTLSLRIGKGRFLEIDPKAGRIFGLLSFHTLARRLSLDFSDLFKKGFVFDSIEGSFLIENGDAYTNDLVMEAPSARISVSGRVGLASQDYDQIVTVTPHFASSLPTASALFGPVGAAVGAAVLLAEKVFRKLPENIDKLLLKQYSITGSWDKPVIRVLEEEEQTEESTANEP